MSKNFRLLIFDTQLQSLRTEKIEVVDSHAIETKQSVYNLEDCAKYYNESDGYIYYIVNSDLPAKVEAENLKSLRRSSALNNMFNYDTKKAFDFMGLMPWVIIILLVLFK